jgi:spectinomycin phosphotransferase
MLEEPELGHEAIADCLRERYEIAAGRIEFLPLGNDSSAWVYRVSAENGQTYFLKARTGALYLPGLVVPHVLKEQGIEQVVAPLATVDGRLWAAAGDFGLILYPFVEGSTGMEVGLSDEQWQTFGSVLKRIHFTKFRGLVSRERFVPNWLPVVRELQQRVMAVDFRSDFEREMAGFWRARAGEISRIVERAEALGQALQRRAGEFVLCHSDIHTANVLLDEAGGLHIVDWDHPLLAPVERDLVFVVGERETAFFKGYGQVEIDPVALAYYRYEWVVQEIGDFGERVFLTDEAGDAPRAEAVRGFMKLFEPGDVVEAAYQSEMGLPE